MRIDTATLLFHELTDAEATELEEFGKVLMLGPLPTEDPETILTWYREAGFDHRQQLLVKAVVLPGRIFYSLLLHSRRQA